MAMTPIEIQKMQFARRLRGVDPVEVQNFLQLVAEDLATRLGELDQLRAENRLHRDRVQGLEIRQNELQDALLRSQRVSDEILATARREVELMIKEAELTGDRIVTQAIEQATRIEGRIAELRTARRDVQLKLRNMLELYGTILEADRQEDQSTGTLHTLPRTRRKP
jgi:cell division initiation protein